MMNDTIGRKLRPLITRLVASWVAAAALISLFGNPKRTSLPAAAAWILLAFLLLSVVRAAVTVFRSKIGKNGGKPDGTEPDAIPDADDVFLAAALLVYAFAVLFGCGSFEIFLGVLALLCAAGCYLLPRLLPESRAFVPGKKTMTGVSAASAAVFFLLVGGLTSLRYLIFVCPNFDFGIFCNMFANMKASLSPVTTCERDMLLSHFAVHLSPVYYLLLPIYALFPSPVTLQLAQAAVLASGVLPLCLICRKKELSYKACAFFSAAYCAYPALAGGCMYDLHENCFLPPLILWVFYCCLCFDRNGTAATGKTALPRALGFWLLPLLPAAALLSVKEDAAVYLAFAALLILAEAATDKKGPRHYLRAGLLFVLAVGYFLFASGYLKANGLGIMSYRYDNLLPDKNAGLGGVFVTLLRDPAAVAREILETDKLIFVLQMLLPLGFLPLLCKKPQRLICLGPLVLIGLMSDYVYQHSIMFQYVFGPLAFLFLGAVLNFADLKRMTKRALCALALVSALLLSASLLGDRVRYVGEYAKNSEEYAETQEILDSIPKDASVIATSFLVPHLSGHTVLYEEKYTDETADYIAIDLRYDDPEATIEKYLSLGYETFAEGEMVTVLAAGQ